MFIVVYEGALILGILSCDSDDAIAAFIETSGESLRELALNHIRKVLNVNLTCC